MRDKKVEKTTVSFKKVGKTLFKSDQQFYFGCSDNSISRFSLNNIIFLYDKIFCKKYDTWIRMSYINNNIGDILYIKNICQ